MHFIHELKVVVAENKQTQNERKKKQKKREKTKLLS